MDTRTTKQESVQHILQFKKPYDAHSLRVFLGLAGHFCAFIKSYATRTKCLTIHMRKDLPFKWTGECQQAYNDSVTTLSCDSVPTLPGFNLPF